MLCGVQHRAGGACKDTSGTENSSPTNSQAILEVRLHIKGKGSPYSITKRRVPLLCSQPAGDVSHKPDGRLPLLSARPAVTPATLKMAATNFATW